MGNPEQGKLFQAETSWFHVFRAMVESGDVAKLGPHAVTCYLVIKSYTNWSTGKAFPALETIATKAGISLAQVKRSLTALEGGILHIENLTINVFKDNAQQVNITAPTEALNAMKRILGKKGST